MDKILRIVPKNIGPFFFFFFFLSFVTFFSVFPKFVPRATEKRIAGRRLVTPRLRLSRYPWSLIEFRWSYCYWKWPNMVRIFFCQLLNPLYDHAPFKKPGLNIPKLCDLSLVLHKMIFYAIFRMLWLILRQTTEIDK